MIDIWEIDRLWRVYRTIEKDLLEVDSYVEPGQEKVYSVVFKKIILVSGALIEEVLKKLCSIISPVENAGNISEYKRIIVGKIPKISTVEIYAQTWSYRLVQPFASWSDNNKLAFWERYNEIKHSPDNVKLANFGLAINMVAALYILLLYINDMTEYGAMNTSSQYFYSEYSQEEAPKLRHKDLPYD